MMYDVYLKLCFEHNLILNKLKGQEKRNLHLYSVEV
jgi:hypothetical protein